MRVLDACASSAVSALILRHTYPDVPGWAIGIVVAVVFNLRIGGHGVRNALRERTP